MSKSVLPLQFDRPVILVGPADFDIQSFNALFEQGYKVIAADGGANRLIDNNIHPTAIIGDLDSLHSVAGLSSDTRIIQIAEQDTTDFEKCLNHVVAPAYLAMGFTGRRLDHTLANTHSITKFHGTRNVLLVGIEDVSFVQKGNFTSLAPENTAVSIFPVMPIQFSSSKGLRYPLDHLEMEIGNLVGTSNSTVDDEYTIIPAKHCLDTPYLISLSNQNLHELIIINLKSMMDH